MATVLITIEQACERLCISRKTFIRLVQSGEIQTVRFGRMVRVPLDGVESWVSEHLDRRDGDPA